MEPATNPTADQLREKAAEILSRRAYTSDSRSQSDAWLTELVIEILEWVSRPFRWLFNMMDGLPDVLRWMIVIGLVVVLAILIWHMASTLTAAIRGTKLVGSAAYEPRRQLLDPEHFEKLAREAARKNDFITAIRMLFRAAVLRIELSEKKTHRPGVTNRELLNRYRAQPRLHSRLKLFVDMIDRKWYGDELCSQIDFEICESAHVDVRTIVQEQPHALGA